MKITSLVDNIGPGSTCTEHGLSLYIETDGGARILFDMGQGELFLRNSRLVNVDLPSVDLAIVSHGHYDHGGGLGFFLKANNHAPVHIRAEAFEPHWSLKPEGLKPIGLDNGLKDNPRLVFSEAKQKILDTGSESCILFVAGDEGFAPPPGNALLMGPETSEPDSFAHEQSLMILTEDKCVLFAGCAHRGAVNILRTAERISGRKVTHFFGGLHLAGGQVGKDYVCTLAEALAGFESCKYWTMHCTGEEHFHTLKMLLGDRIDYLCCSRSVII